MGALKRHFSRIRNVKKRLEIDFRDNYFDDSVVEPIADLLANNRGMQELFLWLPSNYVTDRGAVRLFAEVERLTRLRKLVVNLEWNFELTNRSVEALCKAVRQLPEVDSLIVRMSKSTYKAHLRER